jgi:hypothetical protein
LLSNNFLGIWDLSVSFLVSSIEMGGQNSNDLERLGQSTPTKKKKKKKKRQNKT